MSDESEKNNSQDENDDTENKSNDRFQTVSESHFDFGRNNFIEVSRKKYVTKRYEREFLSVARGYYQRDNTKRYKTSVTIPQDKEIIDFVYKELNGMVGSEETDDEKEEEE